MNPTSTLVSSFVYRCYRGFSGTVFIERPGKSVNIYTVGELQAILKRKDLNLKTRKMYMDALRELTGNEI